MLIFIDLDGTLVNTVHPSWKPYKDGLQDYPVDKIPVFDGAKQFIALRKNKGDSLVIISDSHPKYVMPLAKMFGLDSLSLADKPNAKKLNEFINTHTNYKQEIETEGCIFIGDTKLDIEIGRRIQALTIWFLPYCITNEIKDDRDGIGDEMASKKTGPTFVAKTFQEIDTILDSPTNNLYAIESSFAGSSSTKSIRFSNIRYQDGSYACIRCLARQEQGICDKYARADMYYIMSNLNRTREYIETLSKGISDYLNQPAILNQQWDYITYLTDKTTTVPRHKMKEIFDLIDTSIPKVELLKWAEDTDGSLRNKNLYHERKEFLERYLSIYTPKELLSHETEEIHPLANKNIIILDDQLTTGATAWHAIKQFKSSGAKMVLFVALFQMVLAVNNDDVICPRCGKPMILKIRRSDGHRFYSCTPPEYKGDGCGFIVDIPNQ